MQPISYACHQFPLEVIRHAVWLYLGFTLSYQDVEDDVNGKVQYRSVGQTQTGSGRVMR